MTLKKPCMLMILDGWGIEAGGPGNAISLARTPVLDGLKKDYASTRLKCYGEAVGLPRGIMGNSEVGHLNIGAGRVVYQDLLRIDKAIEDGSFARNPVLVEAMQTIRKKDAALHLMGLVSDGGVHSQLMHLYTLMDMAENLGLRKVYIHAILDGRDTAPNSGKGFVTSLHAYTQGGRKGNIATICGRYYAMDRDKRWDRNERAYRLYTAGEGQAETDPNQAVQNAYDKGETDEFVQPIALVDGDGNPAGIIRDDDGVIFFNYRADRARQITRAFTDPDFHEFPRDTKPAICRFVTMTQYDESFSLPIAFEPVHLEMILGEVVSRAGCRQLRIAETEKYAHVTYFFNGGEEKPFAGEDRCLIPSPREVATYDQKPEMSAPQVTTEVLKRLQSGKYDLIILNFANMDMVGHTGVIEAAVRACETLDNAIGRIVKQVRSMCGTLLLTADHGNAEQMLDPNNRPHTAHTTNAVPFILVDDDRKEARLREGSLGDIAPTILEIMGLEQPMEMTGRSLLKTKRG